VPAKPQEIAGARMIGAVTACYNAQHVQAIAGGRQVTEYGLERRSERINSDGSTVTNQP
jgi:hypothetical protein